MGWSKTTLIIQESLDTYFVDQLLQFLPKPIPPLMVLYLSDVLAANRIISDEPIGPRLIQATQRSTIREVSEDALMIAGPFQGYIGRTATRNYYLDMASVGYSRIRFPTDPFINVYQELAYNPDIYAVALLRVVRTG